MGIHSFVLFFTAYTMAPMITNTIPTTTTAIGLCTDNYENCSQLFQSKDGFESRDGFSDALQWRCRDTALCAEGVILLNEDETPIGGCYGVLKEDDCNISAQNDINVYGDVINEGVYQHCKWTAQGCKPIGSRCSEDGRCAVGSTLRQEPTGDDQRILENLLNVPTKDLCMGVWRGHTPVDELYTCDGMCQPWKGDNT